MTPDDVALIALGAVPGVAVIVVQRLVLRRAYAMIAANQKVMAADNEVIETTRRLLALTQDRADRAVIEAGEWKRAAADREEEARLSGDLISELDVRLHELDAELARLRSHPLIAAQEAMRTNKVKRRPDGTVIKEAAE